MTIKNPIEWSGAQFVQAAHVAGSLRRSLHHAQDRVHSPEPAVRNIKIADLTDAIAAGFADFAAYRSDVLFLGVIYAAVGLVLARLAFGMDLLPLLFPLASGFALIGPFAAIGLYEMSLRREHGLGCKLAQRLRCRLRAVLQRHPDAGPVAGGAVPGVARRRLGDLS